VLRPEEFRRICDLLYGLCRIRLQEGKEPLVQARLWRRVRNLGMLDFSEYLAFVESPAGRDERSALVDALTTNKTSFFREAEHFDFLRRLLPTGRRSSLRIWSAGCSSGQEPYTLAIVLREVLAAADLRDARILATDISAPVLARAREGLYDEDEVQGLTPGQLSRWFTPVREGAAKRHRVSEELRSLVRFARLNLMEPWPMRGPFDAIFCRNVMIYFDRETQQQLIQGFEGLLRPGGHLFVGHAESLTGRSAGLTYVQPAVYRRA